TPSDFCVVFRNQGIDTVLVVDLLPRHRGVEDAHGAYVGLGDERVPLVAVEEIHGSGIELVDFAALVVVELAGALDDIDRLDVVGVVHRGGGAGEQDRVVQGEADLVARQQQATGPPRALGAIAVVPLDVAVGADQFGEAAGDHACSFSIAVTASRRMATPSSKSSCGVFSGGRNLTTSSSAPEVSMSRPLSKASLQVRPASSGSAKTRPRARPRPRVLSSRSGCEAAISLSSLSSHSALASTALVNESSRQNSS